MLHEVEKCNLRSWRRPSALEVHPRSQQIESILCPVDFYKFSVYAYEYAQSLAWHYKATLFVQHVVFSPRPSEGWSDASRRAAGKMSRGNFRNLQIATGQLRFDHDA